MSDLITLAEAKTVTGLATLSDATLSRLISAASTIIEHYLQRNVIIASRVETHSGTGCNGLLLDDPLPVALTTVVVTDYDGTANTVLNADFLLDTQATLYFINSPTNTFGYTTFPLGRNNVRVTYTAGMAATTTDVPADLKEAVFELMLRLNASTVSAEVLASGEQLGDYTIRYATNMAPVTIASLPPSVVSVLSYYRNIIL